MKYLHSVIKRPIITEKSNLKKGTHNQYTFEVHPDANKIEIKEAVEKIFKVKVLRVRTLNVLGKRRRVGRSVGKRPDWKKAIVTLKIGEHIEFFEGV
ncbi:MAG TPA: 50S ribosomal protein L23 [Syntrophaceae bacterium]|nr:50S ribosomal protein L23 [Syntrophaceae bacterium]